MKAMRMRDVQKDLGRVLDTVIDDCEELAIPRKGGGAVVVVPLDTWNEMNKRLDRRNSKRTAIQNLVDELRVGYADALRRLGE